MTNPERSGAQRPDPAADSGDPAPLTLVPARPVDLQDIRAVRRELGSLYRSAKRGEISTADASRLCFVLMAIGKLIEAESFEQRLLSLERKRDAVAGTT